MRINPKLMSAIFFGGWITFFLILTLFTFTILWITEYVAIIVWVKLTTKREPSIYDVWDVETE